MPGPGGRPCAGLSAGLPGAVRGGAAVSARGARPFRLEERSRKKPLTVRKCRHRRAAHGTGGDL